MEHVLRNKCQVVGLLASPTTIRTKLYQNMLEAAGARVIVPDCHELQTVEGVIRLVIAGTSLRSLAPKLNEIVLRMKLQGAEMVILGCTELSVVFSGIKDPLVTDPLNLVTDKILGD